MGDDEFQIGSGNWSQQQRSRSSRCSSPASSWPTQVVDVKKPPNLLLNTNDNSNSISSNSSTNLRFQDSQKHHQDHHQDHHHHPNLHMMGLGLSSQSMDWNQPSLFHRSVEKSDESSSFRLMLQEDHDLSSNTTPSFHQAEQQQWPQRSQKMMMYSSSSSADDSEGVFSPLINQSQLMSSTQHNLNPIDHSTRSDTGFHIDSSSYQSNPSTTSMLPGLLGYEFNHQHSTPFDNQTAVITNFNSYPTSFGMNSTSSSSDHDHQLMLQPNSWPPSNNKPQNQLHLSNNAPFWNASAAAPIINHDVRSNFFPSLQMQSASSTFDEKPKKSSSSETSNKRPRNETPSPLPAKARKEKMGDRITALQQLVSPFGKTDTASVLSEAIEYIKFLHEQVSVLTNAYMKSGAPVQQQQQQQQQKPIKKDAADGQKQDLRSRGLCLVPVSSTFPVTHETTVDFWNPTYGGTFR